MKNSFGKRQLSATVIVAAALCPMLAACSTLNMEDLSPQQAPATSAAAPAQTNQPAQPPRATGAGDYPNLNIAVQPAAEQISAEERQRLVEELNAKKNKTAGPSAQSLSEAERLRLLARQREEEVLSVIESAQ